MTTEYHRLGAILKGSGWNPDGAEDLMLNTMTVVDRAKFLTTKVEEMTDSARELLTKRDAGNRSGKEKATFFDNPKLYEL